MSVTLSKTYYLPLDVFSKLHNLLSGQDTLKLAFVNCTAATMNALNSGAGPHVYADLTGGTAPIALTNLLTSPALTGTGVTQTTGTMTLAASTWTGTSQTGNFGPFQCVVVYNDTAASKNVLGFYDYGSALTLNGANGDQLTITFPSGILTDA